MLENLDLLSQIACQNNIDKLDISEQRAQVLSSVLGGVGVCSQKGLRDLRLEVLLQIKSIAASQYLQRQTFHLTIVYYDCFLAHYLLIITHQNKFAAFDKARDCLILALTCLHIAQKFNESQQLELDQLIYIANDQCKLDNEQIKSPIKKEDVLDLEMYVCHYVLKWQFGAPHGIRSFDGNSQIS